MDGPDNRDLRAACFWATLVAIAVAASDDVFVRTIFGLPAALILPGYVLTRALGLKASSMLEYIVCMIGTSLASMVVGGFVLNIVGLLTPLGWATWLLTVVIAGSYMAARRHEPPALPRWSWPPGLRLRHAIVFALAASLTTGAYALAVHDEAKQQQFRYTEFWLLPSAGSLSLGIRSEEDQKQQFDVEVAVDGRPFAVFRSVEIAPSELWTRQIPVPQQTTPQKAEARLYRLKDMRLYRQVSALVPAS
jgi:uncharacterized membrane protein